MGVGALPSPTYTIIMVSLLGLTLTLLPLALASYVLNVFLEYRRCIRLIK